MLSTIKLYANNVFKVLGPGYNECVYHNALTVALRKKGIPYETERIVPITYDNHVIGNLRADIIIDNSIILELKAVKCITEPMKFQLTNYKKLTGINNGMIINFPQRAGIDVCDFHSEDPLELDI